MAIPAANNRPASPPFAPLGATRPPGNAIMRVRTAALNHVDMYMRDSGKGITHELPMVLGLDACGEEGSPADREPGENRPHRRLLLAALSIYVVQVSTASNEIGT